MFTRRAYDPALPLYTCEALVFGGRAFARGELFPADLGSPAKRRELWTVGKLAHEQRYKPPVAAVVAQPPHGRQQHRR